MRSDDSSRKEFLRSIGIDHPGDVLWNATSPRLYEEVVRRREGLIAHQGPIVVKTGHHTGRSPNDKFIVQEAKSGEKIWWGDVNRPFPEENFERLFQRMLSFLRGSNLYVQDCYAGADSRYRVPVVVITEYAWHNLFARNLFIRQDDTAAVGDGAPAQENEEQPFTVIDLPRFHADPEVDGTNSQTFILVSFDRRLVLIGGTSYAGEMKKSVFTLLNYLLPQQDVLSMHCSANIGPQGDVAVFFGLSGTGKTTLSADPSRRLIGDDEHGWSDEGVFNFEGGCYAKVIRLSEEAEPQIFACTRRFGTILENVTIDPDTRQIDLDDATLTENTRAGYPLDFIDNSVPEKRGGHPKNVIMLTCDAFGVMPPIAKLTPEQAMYHFLSGYTAKVAGTERGMGNEPTATFSTCFGAPFLALPPSVYATMLGERIQRHQVDCWLVNTGWNGGPFGVGERMKIQYTRAMVHAALDGSLAKVPMHPDPVFGVLVPQECPGVPSDVLDPKSTWKDPAAYDRMAAELAHRFRENFKQFAGSVSPEVRNAGPVTQ